MLFRSGDRLLASVAHWAPRGQGPILRAKRLPPIRGQWTPTHAVLPLTVVRFHWDESCGAPPASFATPFVSSNGH